MNFRQLATLPKRLLAIEAAAFISATAYGVVADGVTDDTVAMQAFIDAISANVRTTDGFNAYPGRLPQGDIKITSLTITKPITIEASGSKSTRLIQTASHDQPALKIRVAHTGSDYYSSFNIPATVTLRGMRVQGGDQNSGDAGQHGLDLQNADTNPITTRVQLDDVFLCRFAGYGINAVSFSGWLDGFLVFVQDNNLHGLSANSCHDFHFLNSYFHGNHSSGILLSGCSEFTFIACNIFSNLNYGVYLFATSGVANHRFVGCMIDRNFQHGVNCDLRSASAFVDFIGCSVIYSSQQGDSLYSEVAFASGALGRLKFIGGHFGRTFSQQTTAIERSQYHVLYAGSGGLAVFDAAVSFLAGAAVVSAVRPGAAFYQGLNLPVSAAPASPADGDIWRQDNTNTGLRVRINGVTKTITVS